jgi:hypothetical protein
MSADGSVEIDWADGTHKFRLPIGALRELQDKTNAGPAQILNRFRDNTWRVDDVREVIRLGLIGGGMKPLDALTLVVRYVDNRPLMESFHTAFSVIAVALVGVPEDNPASSGKAQSESQSGSASPTSTAPEPQSGSAPQSLMN